MGPGTGKARVPAHRSTSGPGRGSDGWDRSLSRRLSSPTTATATSGKHSQHLLGGREGRKVCHRRTDSAGHRPGSSRAGRGGRARETGRGAPGGGGGGTLGETAGAGVGTGPALPPFPFPPPSRAGAYLHIEPGPARMRIFGGLQRVGNHIRALAPTRQELPGAGGRWPSAAASASCRQRLQSAQAAELGRGPSWDCPRVPSTPHAHTSAFRSAHSSTTSNRGSQPPCPHGEVAVPVLGIGCPPLGISLHQQWGHLGVLSHSLRCPPPPSTSPVHPAEMQKDIRAKERDLRPQGWGRMPGYSLGGGLSTPICKMGGGTRLGR